MLSDEAYKGTAASCCSRVSQPANYGRDQHFNSADQSQGASAGDWTYAATISHRFH